MIYPPSMACADVIVAEFPVHRARRALDTPLIQRGEAGGLRARAGQSTWAMRRAIVRARSALMNMRLEEASRAIAQLARLLSDKGRLHHLQYARTLGLLRAYQLAAEDDLSGARSVLLTLPYLAGDTLAATLLGYLDWKRDDPEEVCAPDVADYLTAPIGGEAVCRILSLCLSSALAFDRLQLTLSASLATEALQLARLRYGTHSPMSSFPATLLAQVAYEQGRLDEAEALLRSRISVICASGVLECVARASQLFARLLVHRGQLRDALASLRTAEALGRTRRWPRLIAAASAEYARAMTVTHGDGRSFEPCAHRAAAPADPKPGRYLSLVAKPAVPLGLTPRMRELLSRGPLESLPPDEPLSFASIETLLRRACGAAADGSLEDCYELLIPCLQIGAARGLRMVFVDAGAPILALLESLYYSLPTNDSQHCGLRPYIATLLRSTIRADGEQPSPNVGRPLSRRETGILQLIANGWSNKRIAQSLGITPETVKSHAKSIFLKLETRTRAQAVARAEACGLL